MLVVERNLLILGFQLALPMVLMSMEQLDLLIFGKDDGVEAGYGSIDGIKIAFHHVQASLQACGIEK